MTNYRNNVTIDSINDIIVLNILFSVMSSSRFTSSTISSSSGLRVRKFYCQTTITIITTVLVVLVYL